MSVHALNDCDNPYQMSGAGVNNAKIWRPVLHRQKQLLLPNHDRLRPGIYNLASIVFCSTSHRPSRRRDPRPRHKKYEILKGLCAASPQMSCVVQSIPDRFFDEAPCAIAFATSTSSPLKISKAHAITNTTVIVTVRSG